MYAVYKGFTSNIKIQISGGEIEKEIPCQQKQKESEVASLISDKLHQEYITFVNIYVPNIRAPKYTQ